LPLKSPLGSGSYDSFSNAVLVTKQIESETTFLTPRMKKFQLFCHSEAAALWRLKNLCGSAFRGRSKFKTALRLDEQASPLPATSS
jgi:hypothetical protein